MSLKLPARLLVPGPTLARERVSKSLKTILCRSCNPTHYSVWHVEINRYRINRVPVRAISTGGIELSAGDRILRVS